MILTELRIDPADLERRTGWAIKPAGACRGEMCVPLRSIDATDPHALGERLDMPLVAGETGDVWSLGPSAIAGRTLDTAVAPELILPDHTGEEFRLSSLRGQKVFLLAWASW